MAAEAAANRLWSVSVPLRTWRYRRWLVVGQIRWEAVGNRDGSLYLLVLDDGGGEVVRARRARMGLFAPNPLSYVFGQVSGLLVLLPLLGIAAALGNLLGPVASWTLGVVLGLGGLVWLRVLVMRRRQT